MIMTVEFLKLLCILAINNQSEILMIYKVRQTIPEDFRKVLSLYKKVAARTIGISRSAEEISEEYVQNFMLKAHDSGIEMVMENPTNRNELIAEIHCSKLTPKIFNHILGDLTIVVDPDFHGKGIGETLFRKLLEIVNQKRSDILRVELIVRESNSNAIELYKKIGFKIEGRLEKRTRTITNIEADYFMAWFNPNFRSL